MRRFTFFTVNDFTKEGGATIRMVGILNGLAKLGHEVIFMSNCVDDKKYLFDPNINHVSVGYVFTRKNKAYFQFIHSIFPPVVGNFIFSKFLKHLINVFQKDSSNDNIIFFEYIDNTIAYWLNYNKIINKYIDDLHGIAPVEFKVQRKASRSIFLKIKFYIKEKIAERLDKKQYRRTSGFLFASSEMHRYFSEIYPDTARAEAYILPFMTSLFHEKENINETLKHELQLKWNVKDSEKLILFAGAFKVIDGVPDLIEAFYRVSQEQQHLRLILVGDGPTRNECLLKVKTLGLEDKVIFVGRIQYEDLPVYQELSHIIVCPNRQNLFSDLIVHVKYFDALTSGKVVIVGAFKSVFEINMEEQLSLLFKPSDIDSLTETLKRSIVEYEELKIKYQHNVSLIKETMTYPAFFDETIGIVPVKLV